MKIEDRVRATLAARAAAVGERATKAALDSPQSGGASRAPGSVGRWTRRRAVTIVTAAAVFVAAGLFAWSAFSPTPPEATSSPPVAPLSPATCQYGPWAQLCPEADWVRHILREAGIPPIGNTGSAIVARSGGEFYVWTTNIDEEGPISKLVSEDGFERVQSLGYATAVYSDGVRFLWQVGSLYVWLQSGEEGFTIKPDLVATLVLSSQRTPYTATQSADGIQVTYPSDWFMHDGKDLALVSPSVAFVVGSWDFPAGGDCAPSAAVRSIPRDGVLLWLIEYVVSDQPSDFEQRPAHFDLGTLKGPFECVGESAYVVVFRDSGRFFQAQVVLGPDAGAAGKQAAEQVLDSLVVSRSAWVGRLHSGGRSRALPGGEGPTDARPQRM